MATRTVNCRIRAQVTFIYPVIVTCEGDESDDAIEDVAIDMTEERLVLGDADDLIDSISDPGIDKIIDDFYVSSAKIAEINNPNKTRNNRAINET